MRTTRYIGIASALGWGALQVSGIESSLLAWVLASLAVIFIVIGYWPWIRRVRPQFPFRFTQETNPAVLAIPQAAARQPAIASKPAGPQDVFFIGRIEELLREAGRILQQLNQIQGSQATPGIVTNIWKWADEAAPLMEPRYPGDAIDIRALPPDADKYEVELLRGYMYRTSGWLRKRQEELTSQQR